MSVKCPKCQAQNPDTQKFCGKCGTQVEPVHDETKTYRTPAKDSTIDVIISEKYKLLEELGSGGMGVVYKAEQLKPVKRSVALKIIKLGMDTRQVIARFETERQALAVMDHPNIAKVFDGGATETGRPYFVMELVRGIPITKYCDKHKLAIKERLELFIQVCQAVQHAHQKGVIHRDLKPSNILVVVQEDKPVPKIIDFGIAKATEHSLTERTLFTEQGQLIGTPEYMSPEQAEMSGLDVDTRTDIYSLGVILYELLIGMLPFDPRSLREAGFGEIQRIIRETEPPKASTRLSSLGDTQTSIANLRKTDPSSLKRELKGDLDWITVKAMAKDRTQRYASSSEFGADIEKFLRNEPVTAGRPSASYRMKKYIRRHKTGVVAATLVGIAMLIGIAGTSLGLLKAKQAERVAREEAETAKQITDFLVELFEVTDPSESRGNTVTAREILDKGADKINRDLEGQPLVRARMMNIMGKVYHSLGLYDVATPLLKEGLALREQVLGPESKEVAASLESVGILLQRTGQYEEARPILERALAIREKICMPVDPAVASALNNLANLMADVGENERAKQLYERSIAVWEEASGPDHIDVTAPMNNLALLLQTMGDFEEAQALYERCLTIKERELEPDHPELATTLHNLGMLANQLGDTEEARSYYERALVIDEKALGPDHPDFADTLRSLAIVYANEGNLEEALPLFERVLAIDEKAFGPENDRVGSDVSNLGHLNLHMGNYETARKFLERGKAIKERVLGPDHYLIANDLDALAMLNRKTDSPDAARQLFERALTIREQALGPEHPMVATSLGNLASFLVDLGDLEGARQLYERALTVYEKVFGPDHPSVATILGGLGDLLRQAGDYQEARSMWERALAVHEKSQGSDHPDTATSLQGYAELLRDTGDHENSLSYFEQALRIREEKYGQDHPNVAETLELYAALLYKMGRKKEAEESEARAKQIRAKRVGAIQKTP
jgi:serine/threonine protein kinase/tetratricopeptide (TPR) repeat protein